MSTWPATLPDPLNRGYSENDADPNIRSSMDIGAGKVRRRYTAVKTNFQVSYLLTAAQLATLETFYETTVLHGSASFDWTHPRLGGTVTARFLGPYQIRSASCGYYEANIGLEVIP